MIVDSSAIVAIVREEAEAARLSALIAKESDARMSAGNYLEASIVIDGARDPAVSAGLDALLDRLGVAIVPVTASQAKLARQAYREFGKGGGHPAKFNFGDCFAYALATERGEPLLYKGDDFAHAGLARVA